MKQGEGLMNQQDGRRQEDYNFETDKFESVRADPKGGRRQECWPWWMCGVGGI